MANEKISAFTAASALTGTEELGGVQSAANAKITPEQIKTFCNTQVYVGQLDFPPRIIVQGTTNLNVQNHTFDSSTDRLTYIGRMPVTDSITDIYFRTGTVTTGSSLDVRIETVTNGRPSGTLWATNTNAVVVVDNADDNIWKTATLTASASMTAGNLFAVVIVNSSGSPNMVLTGGNAGLGLLSLNATFPMLFQDTGAGTWTSIPTGAFNWVVETATNGVIPLIGITPQSGNGTVSSFNSGSSPDEYALRFQAPFSCQVIGARLWLSNVAAGADFTVSLWNASGTTDAQALAQIAVDGDTTVSTSIDGEYAIYFNTPVTLAKNTTYYIGVRADTANSLSVGEIALDTSTIPEAAKALGHPSTQIYKATRTWTAGTAGAWTTTTNAVPIYTLIFDRAIA